MNWLLLFCCYLSIPTFAQIKTYRFEEIDSMQKAERRDIAVFIHTDWCRYCQLMKNTGFKNDKVVQKLNQSFYFINFNAEEKRKVEFSGRIFSFKQTGNNTGIHELAEQLAEVNGQISFPTLTFLNADYEIIFQYPGYLKTEELFHLLNKISYEQE